MRKAMFVVVAVSVVLSAVAVRRNAGRDRARAEELRAVLSHPPAGAERLWAEWRELHRRHPEWRGK